MKGLDGSWDDETGQFQLVVPALYVDEKNVAYQCPVHGSGGDVFNRIESRSSHCLKRRHDVEIVISDETARDRTAPRPRKKPARSLSGLVGKQEAVDASCLLF